jgi:glycosyltransferase involved in cell wall biosynthesis
MRLSKTIDRESSMSAPARRPHHVCLVNSLRGLGGAELWFLDAARALRRRGVRASLVAQPESALLERARAAGVPAAAIAIRCDGAPWTLARLWWHLRRTGATAVVCNLTKDLKAAGLAGRWAGVPVRLASRESDFPLKSKGYYRWYFRHAATGVLVGSEATRRTVQRSAPWLAPGRLILLPKGIDTARFQPAEPPAGARPPVVGYVGQLIARKGLAALMDAWELVLAGRAPRAPRPRLRLAGAGPWRDRLVAWRESLPDPGTVELVGFLEDVPGFWAGCRVGVLPSRAEGYGLAAAEASACGVPVVGADASSLPEVVADAAPRRSWMPSAAGTGCWP